MVISPNFGGVVARVQPAENGLRGRPRTAARGALAAPVLHQALRPPAQPAAVQLPAGIVLPGARRCHAHERAPIRLRLSASGRHAGARSPPRPLTHASNRRPTHERPTRAGARLARRRGGCGDRLLRPRRPVSRVPRQGELRGGAARAGALLAVLPPGQEVRARARGAARRGGPAARPLGQHRLLVRTAPAL